jgi:hypothetical protein
MGVLLWRERARSQILQQQLAEYNRLNTEAAASAQQASIAALAAEALCLQASRH